MNGKNKCRILKEIRQKIADENDIPYVTRECTFKGECRGTCPRCEAELRYLEEQLEKRRSLGKKVLITAIAAGMAASTTACSVPVEALHNALKTPEPQIDVLDGEIEVMGDVPYIEETGIVPDEYDGPVPGEPEELSGAVAYPDMEEAAAE
ncbi:MAG: hypothetical protein CW338_12185 [Clostridiales bacterium]|nr:hypothetical protein [Clostridiales bacterium]